MGGGVGGGDTVTLQFAGCGCSPDGPTERPQDFPALYAVRCALGAVKFHDFASWEEHSQETSQRSFKDHGREHVSGISLGRECLCGSLTSAY